jgi:hypothetical protein
VEGKDGGAGVQTIVKVVTKLLDMLGIQPGDTPVDVSAVLDQSNLLVAENRWREAIELLAAHNRTRPQLELEKQLVDFRLKAADSLQFTTASSPLNDTDTNEPCWTIEGGIPVIQAETLTARVLSRAMLEHGHLIVRGYIPEVAIKPLRDSIDLALAARVAAYAEEPEPIDEAWYYESPHFPGNHVSYSRRHAEKKFTLTGSIPVIDSPRASFELMELYHQLGLPGLMREFFSDEPLIATRKWMFRLVAPRQDVDDGIGGGWHQDGQFMGDSIRTLNLWAPLSHCGDGTSAPGIAIIPGRIDELMEYGTRGAKLDWTVGSDLVSEIAETTPMVRPRFSPGDALFFDHFGLHRSGHATSQTENRYAIESWFYAASAHGGRPVIPTF